MNIISTKELLIEAQKFKYAVPAFNVHNLETIRAVVAGAVEMNSPVIIATTPGTIDYSGLEYLVSIVKTAAEINNIPISLHLDHCTDIDYVKKCIDAGYRSVMIDASAKSFEKNIETTKKVVEYAHKFGATVEAELGTIGGEEDDIVISEKDALLTDPDKAVEFVEKTGVDSLAVAIGTAHGVYKFEPKLDFERLKEMNKKIQVPLVLHGGSGVPVVSVQRAIEDGICKVNISTELKIPFAKAVKEFFINNPEADDPRKYLTPGVEASKEVVIEKIKMCGSNNKA